MMRTLGFGLLSLSSLVGLAGCGLGDASEDLNAITCQTSLAITGTFTLGQAAATYPDYPTAQPPDANSCWPVGKWSFTVASAATQESSAPQCTTATFESRYEFDVTRVLDDGVTKSYDGFDKITYLTNSAANVRLKISQGGSGSCAGIFEIFTPDGKTVYNLHPALNPATNALTGTGDVTTYQVSQWKPGA